MNVAYPESQFDTDVAAIRGFVDLIKSGFENPEGIAATVAVRVPEYPDQGVAVIYGSDAVTIEPLQDNTRADTRVSIPIATIHRIFREYEYLDWRDPDIIGTIQFDGDLGYANHLAKSCIRPNDWTIARFHSVERLHARMGYAAMSRVDYVHKPTQRALLDIMDAGRPVILTGMETVPANGAWTLDTLVERYGDAVVRVRSATHRQTMAEFVDELKAFQDNPYDDMIEGFVKPYTEGAALPEEMWADFGPPFFGREDFIPPQLWLGAVPTHIPTSSLHRDPRTGFLTQVIGTKRLELYSADQADLVYPMKAYNNYQPCWFKPETPDFGIYPNAARAHSLSVTLHPGEVLVQPAGWFHQVYAMDSPNMSVSYFWLY